MANAHGLDGETIHRLDATVVPGFASRTPPNEFRLFAFGDNETSKGTFTLTKDGAARIMAVFKDQGEDLPFDFDHEMLDPPPGGAKAAGWFVPEVRADGLYARVLRWTPEALKRFADGEVRYFSPAFKATKDGEITALINCAVLNLPATKHQDALVAAGAISYDAAPVVDGAWDADVAKAQLAKWAGGPDKDEIDFGKYAKGFAWVDSANKQTLGAYKLPHHGVEGGKLVTARRGVMAAAAVLQGSRGGADIPEADLAAVKAHLAKHYHQWGGTAPWEATKEQAMAAKKPLTKLGRAINKHASEQEMSHKELAEDLGVDPDHLDECKRLASDEMEDEHHKTLRKLARRMGRPVADLRQLADGNDPDQDGDDDSSPEGDTDHDYAGKGKAAGKTTKASRLDGDDREESVMSKTQEKLIALTKAKTLDEAVEFAVGRLAVATDSGEQIKALTARVEAFEKKEATAEVERIVSAARDAGKLTPDGEKKAREFQGEFGTKALSAYLDALPVVKPAEEKQPQAKDGADVFALSASELRDFNRMWSGHSPEEKAKQLEKLVAYRKAQWERAQEANQ